MCASRQPACRASSTCRSSSRWMSRCVRFVLNRTAIARLRPASRRRRRGDRDELRRRDGRAHLRSRHGVRSRREVRSRRAARDFERIADLPVDTPTAGQVPIRLLADVRREEGPNMVLRENVQRRIVISVQRRRPRSGQRHQRHPHEHRAVGADAGRVSRRIRRAVREPAKRVATARRCSSSAWSRGCSCCSCSRSAARATPCS